MPDSIIRVRGRYEIGSPDAPVPITVGETWKRHWGNRVPSEEVNVAKALASRVRPYWQGVTNRGYSAETLARDIVRRRGFSVAYMSDDPPIVWAFANILRLKPGPLERVQGKRPDYVFNQFGVTTREDLRPPAEEGYELPTVRNRDKYLKAAAAVMYSAVEDLDPESCVYVQDYRGEGASGVGRSGFLFRAMGFVDTADSEGWGAGNSLLVSRAGVVRDILTTTPEYDFLNHPLPFEQ